MSNSINGLNYWESKELEKICMLESTEYHNSNVIFNRNFKEDPFADRIYGTGFLNKLISKYIIKIL